MHKARRPAGLVHAWSFANTSVLDRHLLSTLFSMTERESTPADLEGKQIGPVAVAVTPDRVALYVDTTGDDSDRWLDQAPPGFGSVLLFAVADEFLYDPRIVPFTRTLLHLDQSFEYLAPIPLDSRLTVAGTVTRVRQRGDSYFVTFTAAARDGSRPIIESTSTFVLSAQSPESGALSQDEPPVHKREINADTYRSASRHDLVRYSAATRDFNPLHWDHDFALDAGLPGTVVHGLLMYAWLMQEASRAADGRPIVASKIRFRSALKPAEQAMISTSVEGDNVKIELVRADEQLITGRATVGPPTE
jgi:acyl dehydratase